MNYTDVQGPNTDCNPKLQKNNKLVLEIWLVNHNVVPGSTKMLTQEHVGLGNIRLCTDLIEPPTPARRRHLKNGSCPGAFSVEQLHSSSPTDRSLGKGRATTHRHTAYRWPLYGCGLFRPRLLLHCWACCPGFVPGPHWRSTCGNCEAPKTNWGDIPQQQVLFGAVRCLRWWHKYGKLTMSMVFFSNQCKIIRAINNK